MNYQIECLSSDIDNGTMVDNVKQFADLVTGHRIVHVDRSVECRRCTVITLDNGVCAELIDTADCCAYTELKAFLLHSDKIDHIITGVRTTDECSVWHVYADMGDILTLTVDWSCGNPFYYSYGFVIRTRECRNR